MKLVEDLVTAPWQVVGAMEVSDSQWDHWKKLFNDIANLHVPMKEARVGSKSLLWIIRKIRVLMRARTYHLTKVKKNRKLEDWAKFKT